eukprot:gene7134-10995_t
MVEKQAADMRNLSDRAKAMEEKLAASAGLAEQVTELDSKIDRVHQETETQEMVEFVATKEITPLNLAELVEYCKQEDYRTHLFLYRELPIRTAIAVQQLCNLPHGFTTMKSTRLVKQWLLEEFDALMQCAKPETPETEEKFTRLLRRLHKRYQESIITLGKGLWELKQDMLHNKAKVQDKKQAWSRINASIVTEYPQLQEQLDRYYAGVHHKHPLPLWAPGNAALGASVSRIAAGFLIRQHISVAAAKKRGPRKGQSDDYIGLVCGKTDLFEVCRGAIAEAREICEEQYGSAPNILLTRSPQTQKSVVIPHIPAHLHYILFELLKNSLRATVEKHGKQRGSGQFDCRECPAVTVTVCDCDRLEDLSVKISDSGGGIPFKDMDKVMSYMYTTAE